MNARILKKFLPVLFILVAGKIFPSAFSWGEKKSMQSFKIVCGQKTVKPGDSPNLTIEITRRNGKTYFAERAGVSKNLKQKQSWDDFEITVNGGANITHERLNVNNDYRTLTNKKNIEIIITHKVLKKTEKLIVPIDFNGDTEFEFGGESGFGGSKGSRGHRLFAREGVSGEAGGNGNDGENGDDIVVYVKQFKTDFSTDTFIKVLVKSVARDTSLLFIHNIQKYKLKISASGGNGGDGAKGGRGSNGKNARAATEKKSGREAGNGGDGGNGGNGGAGGNAGFITFYIEKNLEKYLPNIKLENYAGIGGKPGLGGVGGIGGSSDGEYPAGKDGNSGKDGSAGVNGKNAPPPVINTTEQIFVDF